MRFRTIILTATLALVPAIAHAQSADDAKTASHGVCDVFPDLQQALDFEATLTKAERATAQWQIVPNNGLVSPDDPSVVYLTYWGRGLSSVECAWAPAGE